MNIKTLAVTILTVILSLVSADFMSAQNFHYRKGWEYANIDWERSAFSEWEDGMAAGEMSSTIMVAACYMREYGVGRNVSKGVSIMENLASKNTDVALFAANFWFPILDGDPFFDYSPHAGGQYNMWSMFQWWQEKDLRATNFGLEANYAKVIKFSKMYLAKVSTGYGANLAKEMIGYCYENGGNGVSKDLSKALEYYSGLNRFYELATKLIESTGTIEEMEQEVSKLKSYIKDEDVLSSLESKTWTAGTYDYLPAARDFLKVYFDKYAAASASNALNWWQQHNLYQNSEQFKNDYKELNSELQSEVIKLLDKEYEKTDCPDSLFKIWEVYPCDDATYKEVDEIAGKYTLLINEKIKSEFNGSYYQLFSKYWDLLNNNPIMNSGLHHYDTFSSGEYLSPRYKSYAEYIYVEAENFFREWANQYVTNLSQPSPASWIWDLTAVPAECNKDNICIGTALRNNGRECIINTKKELESKLTLIAEKDSILNFFVPTFAEEIQTKELNIKQAYDFIEILEKENNKTITLEDYSSYLEKYPDAYYKQYCIDGYAMAKADTFTLDTPKDEIKKLLDSGLSKGAAKYVKTVTKKSYLKSKSL